MKRRHILALDAWLGGSHQQFLEGWQRNSSHEIEVRGLRPRSFRWRMRSSSWQFARDLCEESPMRPDALLVTGFTDVAGLRGMLPHGWRELPLVLYMHENQLSYPRRDGEEAARDHHLGFTQILSCLSADLVVFNSSFHRAEFERAALEFLSHLPKPNPRVALQERLQHSQVIAPGLDLEAIPLGAGAPTGSALRVLFNQRWEWDKAPEVALRAAEAANDAEHPIELCLLGERAPSQPETRLPIAHAGFAEDRAQYANLLGSCDVVISTALHEFFGIAVGEAIAAGCCPLVPQRLAYPELTQSVPGSALYAGEDDARELTALLRQHAGAQRESHRDPVLREDRRQGVSAFSIVETARALDRTLETLLSSI